MHHAGMLRADRNVVERLFISGAIRVLCCTATLAWGVNLPAHTVIIKGTQLYDSKHGKFVDLGMLDVMQIFGRAGRPQYDTSGEGIIITEHSSLNNYLRLMTNQLHIESQFVSRLSDNLNAEVALGTVSNLSEAVTWLSYTYLHVRLQKNPLNYGVTWAEVELDPELGRYRRKLIESAARNLDNCRMIRFDELSGQLASTDLGRTASTFYIDHETIMTFNESLKPSLDEAELLSIVCQAHEFENIMVREEELEELEALLKKACRIAVKGGVENRYGKVNILLQAYLSHAPIKAFALVSDTAYVVQNASRILRGVFDMMLKQRWSSMAKMALTLCKMVDRRTWEQQHALSQFGSLRPEIGYKLQERRLGLDELFEMTPSDIGAAIRHPHMGREILALVKQVPFVELEVKVQPITRTVLRVQVLITPAFDWNDRVHGSVEPFWLLVEDTASEQIYHSEAFLLYKKGMGDTHEVCFTIPIFEPLPPQYFVRLISDRWLHAENEAVMEFKHLLLPELHAPHTELLDLQPLPLSVLNDKESERIFRFSHFNPIQTQVFHTLRHTDENVLLGAPTGSGKTVVAELAMLRLFEQYPDRKVIYIGPLKALVRERMRDWRAKFVDTLGKRMVELTGDVTPDIRALKAAHIVTTTPEKWDGISRSWQQRSYVKKAGLVIIDEIHLLGQERGPILEVIVSRMHYISTKTEQPIRIIGLSTALANAHDLAAWLGIGRAGLFNFKAHYRPVPLEIHIQGFDTKHYCPRMATMNKPTYNAIQTYSRVKPVLVFVSSRRQTRLTAMDLIAYCAASEYPQQFVAMSDGELATALQRVRDTNLRHTLSFGIGLHHAGLSDSDRDVVERLFGTNKIQVLVSTSTLAWGVNLPAHLVVVKGTEFFDGKTQRYVDMPITDVLQMIGRAGRPQFDKSGTAVILVHEPKKNFYKKFLHEPFPVESSLLDALHDHINAEAVAGTISCKQDAIDYMTWTYFYRRLLMNPSYYGLSSTEPDAVSAFLSEKIDAILGDLQYAQCIGIDGCNIEPLTLGRIGAYYYLNFVTMQLFSADINDANTIESLLSLLCNTAEYDELPVRHNEEHLNEQLADLLPIKFEAHAYEDPHVKAHLLLQAHFSHCVLPVSDYVTDTKSVLDQAIRILQAMVDVSADGGWLFTTLNTMKLMQMVVQARWHDESTLLTLPHVTPQVLQVLERNVCCAIVQESPPALTLSDPCVKTCL
jgi:activating signal cointegrator complex subunit 3